MHYVRTIALALVALLLAAACSSGTSTSSDSGTDDAPQSIVSLSPTATEMLFAIGAGDQVVAVDDQSNYPAEAPTTDLSGYDVNVEAIIGYDPDLVVASDDTAAAGLEAADVELMVLPAATTLEDTYDQIEELGRATGHVDQAAQVVADIQSDMADIAESIPARATATTYYHELDDTYYSVTSSTFIGQIYAMAGLENIADAADPDGSGYPQLSSELIVSADPDLIFLADTVCCGQSAETVAARPGWGQLSAVQTQGVVALDDDIASRWGPRVVDLFQQVADAVAGLPAA